MENPENLLDLKYVNRDGDTMRGPLLLNGEAQVDGEATSKSYVDRLNTNLGNQALLRDGSQPMTGPLTLSGPPTAALHAATRAFVANVIAAGVAGLATTVYVDAQDAIERAYADALDAAMTIYVDAADALRLPLAGGVMAGFITLHADPLLAMEAATKQYVDALPVGLNTYDAVVAAVGGDYTSVAAACAGEAAGARIFIKSGTYNEAGSVTMLDGQMLVGENPENTIIDFGGGAFKITSVGAMTNLTVRDLTVQNSIANYIVELVGDYARIENCRVIGSATGQGIRLTGDYGVIARNDVTGFTAVAAFACRAEGVHIKVIGNRFGSSRRGLLAGGTYCSVTSNSFTACTDYQVEFMEFAVATGNEFLGNSALRIFGEKVIITGNFIFGATGIQWGGIRDYCTITGNVFHNSQILSNLGTDNCVVSGNMFFAGTGVTVDGENWTISGNSFQGAAHVTLAAGSERCSVTGNSFGGSTAVPVLADAGMGNTWSGNSGVNVGMKKKFYRMKNTSGGALAAGDTVVLKAVAAGDEITTTVNQGDDMVFGTLDEAINNNLYGQVQTEGETVKLKVNGVINIGIGDLLGTFTAAGIAQQAQAADMAFAIALEAYAGADSNGVIDALLITPRKV